MEDHRHFTRRTMVASLAAVTGVALIGCGQARTPDPGKRGTPEPSVTPVSAAPSSMTVYRDPSCGCCEAWAKIARDAGFEVNVIDRPDMPAIKAQYGVPDELLSCHTTIVGGYAAEGHVPIADIQRLLKEQPRGIKGIAVPGMPRGSPGMEMPDGAKDPIKVMAFDAEGRVSIYRA